MIYNSDLIRFEKSAKTIVFLDQTGQLGGAELMLLDIAAEFRTNARVILFENGPFLLALQAADISSEVVEIGKAAGRVSTKGGAGRYLSAVPNVISLVFKICRKVNSSEIIYANTAKALLVGSIVSFIRGARLVYHLHDILDGTHFSYINRRLLVSLSNLFASKVIANSYATKAAFEAAGGSLDLAVVIYNGFKLGSHISSEKATQRMSEFGWDPSDGIPIFAIFGRLTRWKGQIVFLEALSKIPSARGVIVGEALFTLEDNMYAAELQSRAEMPDLRGRVKFVGFTQDVMEWMKIVDFVVHCSIQPEPFGRVIVEAMLVGTPVVATEGGGASEIVRCGENGTTMPPSDPDALRTVFADFVANPSKYLQMAALAQREAHLNFSLDDVLGKIRSILETL